MQTTIIASENNDDDVLKYSIENNDEDYGDYVHDCKIYLIIRRCARTGAFPGAFCVPNSVALASPTLWGVQWAIH